MDFSKTYDCLPPDILIKKIEAYNLDNPSPNLVNDYLSLRKQRRKLALRRVPGLMLLWGIRKGSILGPLLFKIFVNDVFLFIEK